jgi:hypothetical protein
MDQAQERDIKFVRPTDECDVCEGIGINYDHDRFSKVRSVIRENSLWSLVIICEQKTFDLTDCFESMSRTLENIVVDDRNLFAVGLAADAWNRLINNHGESRCEEVNRLTSALERLPIRPWDSLYRGGYAISDIQKFID